MPSVYEGFGLPILEAMSMNCMILCSNIPIFREIVGSNAIFFDPLSSESIAEALHQSLNVQELPTEIMHTRPAFDDFMNEVDDGNELFVWS